MLPNTIPPLSSTVPKTRDPETVRRDLEQLVKLAMDHGARESFLASGKLLVFDRTLAVVGDAAGGRDNLSEHWPVKYPLESLWDSIRSFGKGVFFSYPAPQGMPDLGQAWIDDPEYRQACLQVSSILTAVESDAFSRGYHMAAGFGAGNCRSVLCHKEARCQALLRARGCIHPYKARPSMAAVGLDAGAMAKALDVSQSPDGVNLYGLVMVA